MHLGRGRSASRLACGMAASLVVGTGKSYAGRCCQTSTICATTQQPGQDLLLPRSTGAAAVIPPPASVVSQPYRLRHSHPGTAPDAVGDHFPLAAGPFGLRHPTQPRHQTPKPWR